MAEREREMAEALVKARDALNCLRMERWEGDWCWCVAKGGDEHHPACEYAAQAFVALEAALGRAGGGR